MITQRFVFVNRGSEKTDFQTHPAAIPVMHPPRGRWREGGGRGYISLPSPNILYLVFLTKFTARDICKK